MIESVNGILWGAPAVLVFLCTGIFFSIKLGFFQLRKPFLIFRRTLFAANTPGADGVSPFKASCTALCACIGTGNIVGAAFAVTAGGAGALFWMWIASFFGMATAYAENSLSINYRINTGKGYKGGAMYTVRDGISRLRGGKIFAKVLSVSYAVFTVFASLGMGCAAQVNTAAVALHSAFGIYPVIAGAVFAVLYAVISRGGMRRVSDVAGVTVPLMSVFYCAAAFIVLFVKRDSIPEVLAQVFRGAFGFTAVSGGFSGAVLRNALTHGIRRGVFSNEAGLGSAAAAHAASSLTSPSDAGLWGAFEVFFDTIFMCTLTALTVLCVPRASGAADAFGAVFGAAAEKIVGVCLTLFAFSTVTGWGAYGENAAVFAFGAKAAAVYRAVFCVSLVFGAWGSFEAVWGLSDLFNMLLAVPNIISLFLLSEQVEPVSGGKTHTRSARLLSIPGK